MLISSQAPVGLPKHDIKQVDICQRLVVDTNYKMGCNLIMKGSLNFVQAFVDQHAERVQIRDKQSGLTLQSVTR